MKRNQFILFLVFALFAGNVFSQSALQELVVVSGEKDRAIYKRCTPEDGVLVFNTNISGLNFSLPDNPTRLKNKPEFDTKNNCYVLCVQKTDPEEDLTGTYKYYINITGSTYKSYILEVTNVKPGEAQIFSIFTRDNTVVITVLDKDSKPLSSAKITIQETGDEWRTNSKGESKVELPSANQATLVVSHREYSDKKTVIVSPGDKQPVQLMEYNPPRNITDILSVEVTVLDDLKNPLTDINIKGKFRDYSIVKPGVYKFVLLDAQSTTLAISHPAYNDKYEITVRAGDEKQQIVQFKNYRYVAVTASDEAGYPLKDAKIVIKGTNGEAYTDHNGYCKLRLPGTDPETLVISHRLYLDSPEISVRLGDQKNIRFKNFDTSMSRPVSLTVFRDGNNRLPNAKVGIKGSNYKAYTNSRGVCMVELPGGKPATVVVSHPRTFDKPKIRVVPGEEKTVSLYDFHNKWHFGIVGGLSVSNIQSDSWIYNEGRGSRLGFAGGMSFEYQITRHLSIQPELLFVMKGAAGKTHTSDRYYDTQTGTYLSNVLVKDSMRINYFELPLNLVFNIPVGKKKTDIFIGAGYYISYGIYGNLVFFPSKDGYLFDEDKEKVFSDNKWLNRFDHGINCILGIRIAQGVFIRAGYVRSLDNMAAQHGEDFASFKNNCFTISSGCFF
jgi:hypothetical protein